MIARDLRKERSLTWKQFRTWLRGGWRKGLAVGLAACALALSANAQTQAGSGGTRTAATPPKPPENPQANPDGEAPVICTAENECCPPQQEKASGPISAGGSNPSGTGCSIGGEQFTNMSSPAAGNAGQGVAACYSSTIRVTNPRNRRYSLIDGYQFVPRSGAGCATFVLCNIRQGCDNVTVKCVITNPDGTRTTEEHVECVCTPVQFGGPSGSGAHPAGFLFDRQINDVSIGCPLVFRGEESGAELWWHYAFGPMAGAYQYIEVKHNDGSVARYEATNKVMRDHDLGHNGKWWRLLWTLDPYDNKTVYSYDASEKLAQVEFPNGLVENWDWSPAWVGTNFDSGHSGIEVTYTRKGSATVMADLTWYMVFQNLGTGGSQTHFNGKMLYYYAQASKFVPDPQSASLYDVTSPTTAHVVTQFGYGSGANADDVVLISKYRHTFGSPPVPPTGAEDVRAVLETTYVASGAHAGKVEHQTLVQYALGTTYSYDDASTYPLSYPYAVPSGVTLHTLKVTAADGSYTVSEFDPVKERVYRSRRIPTSGSPSADGRPRATEGNFGEATALSEPDEVIVDNVYDSTCVCQKPIRIEVRSKRGSTLSRARITRYEYDSVTKLVTKMWSPNPSTAPNQPSEVLTSYEYHTESTTWSPHWIAKVTTPDGVVMYSYPSPMDRVVSDGSHGKKQGKIVRTQLSVRRQTDENTVGSSNISDSIVCNVPGNPTSGFPGFSGPSSSAPQGQWPQGQPRVMQDGDGVVTNLEYDSNYGRLSKIVSGGLETGYVQDIWGRCSSIVQNAQSTTLSLQWNYEQGVFGETYRTYTNTVPVVESKYYYDFWGNPAVTLQRNLASDNGLPHRNGAQPGGARAWIRSEILWMFHLPVEIRVDRRPLDEGDSNPFGGTNPLMAVTEIQHTDFKRVVVLPNGSVKEEVFDGYGMLFKTTVKESAAVNSPVLQVSRTYCNDWLEPVTMAYGQPSGGAATTRWVRLDRNDAGAVIRYVEPVAPQITGYTGFLGGAIHEFDLDQLGRITEARTLDGTTLVAKANLSYDQLGRVMKTWKHVVGTSDSYWAINTYADGKISQLESRSALASPLITYAFNANGLIQEIHDDQGSGGNRTNYYYEPNTPFVNRTVQTLVGASSASYETTYVLDRFGRSTQTRVGASQSTTTKHSYWYTSLGAVDTYTDPLLNVQTFLSDAMGRGVEHAKVGATNTIVNKSEFTDSGLASSRTRMKQIDGRDHETVTHYDFAGRPFLVQNPGANYGVEPTSTDPNEPNCLFAFYDELSQISRVCDGDGGQVAFTYDGLGRVIIRELLTLQTNISFFNTKDVIQRNARGQVVIAGMFGATNAYSDPPGSSAANNLFVGMEFFSTDSIGRTNSEAYLSAFANNLMDVQSTYQGADPFRRGLALVDNLSGQVSQPVLMEFLPDAVGRMAQVKWNRWGGMDVLADYTWTGGMENSRTVRYGTGATPPLDATSFGYDGYGRLSLIQNLVTPAGGGTPVETSKFTFGYDLASNLKKVEYAKVGGWVGDRFKYDEFHRLTEAYQGVNSAIMQPAPEIDPTGYNASSTKTLLTYALDAANNRDTTEFQEGTPNPTTTAYVLDQGTSPASGSNRYVSAGVTIFEHDNRGNLIYDGQFYYRYDFLNRLQEVWRVVPVDPIQEDLEAQTGTKFGVVDQAQVLEESRQDVKEEVPNLMGRVPTEHMDPTFRARLKATIRGGVLRLGTGGPSGGGRLGVQMLPANLVLHALYGYDAFNRRTLRVIVGSDSLVSAYDGWREVAEYTLAQSQAQPVRQFIHGSRLDEMISYRRRVGAVGTYAWETYYVQHGIMDSAARLMDESGQVAEKYEHDPYGKTKIYSAAGTEILWANCKGLPFLWKGVHFDWETGLLYMRNRYYSATTGRFLSMDGLGSWADGINLGNCYCYTGNTPYAGSDPLGLILIAVDGTNSRESVHKDPGTGRFNSHTKNFFDDYRLSDGETGKFYFDGPGITGVDTAYIIRKVMDELKRALCKNPDQPINIIGHSRGGLIAIEVARLLKTLTICGRSGFKVNFLGLLDPVDSALGVGSSEENIPSNVAHAVGLYGDPDLGSRPLFNTIDGGVEDSKSTKFIELKFWGTHSAMGGDPWGGDHPTIKGDFPLVTEEEDRRASNRVWEKLRWFAMSMGNIGFQQK